MDSVCAAMAIQALHVKPQCVRMIATVVVNVWLQVCVLVQLVSVAATVVSRCSTA